VDLLVRSAVGQRSTTNPLGQILLVGFWVPLYTNQGFAFEKRP
jgi:hypothetical protein